MTGEETATLAAIRCKELGIELPDWAYRAMVEHPENAGVIGDAVLVQAGLIKPPQ